MCQGALEGPNLGTDVKNRKPCLVHTCDTYSSVVYTKAPTYKLSPARQYACEMTGNPYYYYNARFNLKRRNQSSCRFSAKNAHVCHRCASHGKTGALAARPDTHLCSFSVMPAHVPRQHSLQLSLHPEF